MAFRRYSKMVEYRIEKWLEDTSKKLDISGLDLKEWPKALKGKEHLIAQLYCSHNQLTSLPALSNCVKLYCFHNQLTSLPPLPNCVELICSYNQLTTLTPSGGTSRPALPNCVELHCGNNQLTSLPELPKCAVLWCSNNQLTSLPTLPKCVFFYCYDNRLFSTDLSDWKKLWKLKSSIYRTRGINKFLRIIRLRLYLPRLNKIKEELLESPNHPGKFYQIPLKKAFNKYKKVTKTH